jgi:hypothetical protein
MQLAAGFQVGSSENAVAHDLAKRAGCTGRECLGVKYLNTTVFECYDIIMIYYGIFYIISTAHV